MEHTPPDALSSFAQLGRTRLRIELKKRGLSPSGLKNELLARLQEHLQKQKDSGLSIEAIDVPPPKIKGGRRKRRQKRPVEDPPDDETTKSDEEADYQPEKESAEEQNGGVKKRGRKRTTTNKEEDTQKCNKKVRSKRTSQLSTPATRTTLISGQAFVKEVRHDMPPNPVIRCVEQFHFEGEQFRFTYRFWRGKVLRHHFEIEGGTYSLHPDNTNAGNELGDPPERDQQPAEATSSKEDVSVHGTANGKENNVEEAPRDGALALDPLPVPTAPSTSTPNTTKTGNRVQKLVLHWPSYIQSSSLKAWQFDKTYPRLLLIFQPAPASSDPSASSPSKPESIILVSKHNGVFLPEGT